MQDLCNLIILVSAVIIAGKNIYGFFKKPVDTIQENAEKKEEKHITEVINKLLPDMLKKNNEPLMEVINEIKNLSIEQSGQIDSISESMKLINEAQMDVMRYNMNRIYYKYRPYKKILDCDKKAFIKFYTDYHSMGGNTWIDALYEEVITWQIVEDEDELKLDK